MLCKACADRRDAVFYTFVLQRNFVFVLFVFFRSFRGTFDGSRLVVDLWNIAEVFLGICRFATEARLAQTGV